MLGPEETAHLVDGIKSVGFEFATRGGMTIGLFDIEIPKDKAEPPRRRPTTPVAEIDRQFQRGLITEDERYEQVVDVWQETTDEHVRRDDEVARPDGPGHDDDRLRRPGNKGNIGQLGAMRGLMADPSGRIIDVPVRSNFREGMTVLEYFISTHGARKGLADTALRTADSGLPDPAPGRRRAGRHHPRGRLRHRGGQLDHPRAESSDEKGAFQTPARRPAGRGPAARPAGQGQEGRDPPLIVDRNEVITEEIAARDRRGRDRRGPRPLAAHLRGPLRRLPGVLRPQPRHRRDGRLGRGGRHHRRPVDRRAGHAADDADVPHRRRRRAWTSPPACRASRSCSRPASPRARPRSATSTASSRSSAATAGPRSRSSRTRGLRHRRWRCRPGAEMLAAPGDLVELGQVLARAEAGRRHDRRRRAGRGLPRQGRRRPRRPGRGRRRARVPDPAQRQAPGRERPGDPRRRRHHRRPDQPAGVPRHPGQGRRPALPGQGSPEGLPEPGRHDQRQAHRDHRPADAPQGPHRPAGRRRPAADRAGRSARLRGGTTTASWPRAASRRRPRPCCSA